MGPKDQCILILNIIIIVVVIIIYSSFLFLFGLNVLIYQHLISYKHKLIIISIKKHEELSHFTKIMMCWTLDAPSHV